MNSNEIALNFYKQGLANKWLSQRRTSWLYGQACREAKRKLTTHGTPTANGMFTLESGETIGWEIAISSQNGCAVFQTHSVTALIQQQEAERESLSKDGAMYARTYAERFHMDTTVLARMFKASVAQVEQWIREGELNQDGENEDQA